MLSCFACSAVAGKVSGDVMRAAALLWACRPVWVSLLSPRPLMLVAGLGAGGTLPVPIRFSLWVFPNHIGGEAWAIGVGG